jgi:hypothetical protein
MPSNRYVRIAIIVVLVIVLYYLVIALGRGVSGADDTQVSSAASGRLADAGERR